MLNFRRVSSIDLVLFAPNMWASKMTEKSLASRPYQFRTSRKTPKRCRGATDMQLLKIEKRLGNFQKGKCFESLWNPTNQEKRGETHGNSYYLSLCLLKKQKNPHKRVPLESMNHLQRWKLQKNWHRSIPQAPTLKGQKMTFSLWIL